MTKRTFFLGAAIATIIAATPASAAPSTVGKGASVSAPFAARPSLGTRVRVAFNPPLEVPIRYEFAQSGPDPRYTIAPEWLVVRFTRSGDGYRMETLYEARVTMSASGAHGTVKHASTPVTFRLDKSGSIVGIEDEDAYLKYINSVADDLERDPHSRTEAAPLRRAVQELRRLPEKERARLIGRNFALVTAPPIEVAVGDTIELQSDGMALPFPGMELAVKGRMVATLVSAAGNEAHLEGETRFDQQGLDAALRQLIAIDPEGTPPPEGAPMWQHTSWSFSPDTGLTSFYVDTLVQAGAGAASKIILRRALRRVR